jgi:hypothetical protein
LTVAQPAQSLCLSEMKYGIFILKSEAELLHRH